MLYSGICALYLASGDGDQQGGDGVLRVQAEADAESPSHLHHPQVKTIHRTNQQHELNLCPPPNSARAGGGTHVISCRGRMTIDPSTNIY